MKADTVLKYINKNQEERAEILELLKEIEWQHTRPVDFVCACSCSWWSQKKHADNCKLAAMIKKLEGEL